VTQTKQPPANPGRFTRGRADMLEHILENQCRNQELMRLAGLWPE